MTLEQKRFLVLAGSGSVGVAAILPYAVVVGSIVVLNALPGIASGWLYWRHGLGAAMRAHFSADLVLHVLTPLARSIGRPLA